MGTPAMGRARQEVQLTAGEHVILPTATEKLLGCNIHENMKWGEHLQLNEQSLTRQLTSRVNALSKVAVNATFKTRLMAANGAFMSVLNYLIPLWGGTEAYLIKGLQVLQNRAARCVTKQHWFTPTARLLNQCNWLSVQQLVQYHSLLQVHKAVRAGAPFYLSSKLSTEHPYPTRQATQGGIRQTFTGQSTLAQRSFFGRAHSTYNTIPAEIRAARSLPTFKKRLRAWVKATVSVG